MRVSWARLLLNLHGLNWTTSSFFFSASSLSTGGWGDLALVERKEMLTQPSLNPFRLKILRCFRLYTGFFMRLCLCIRIVTFQWYGLFNPNLYVSETFLNILWTILVTTGFTFCSGSPLWTHKMLSLEPSPPHQGPLLLHPVPVLHLHPAADASVHMWR